MLRKKIAIIGAGIGGLSSAALLAKEGFDVTVIEKNDVIGGRAAVYQDAGFTFDMGPSWYLMPDVFEKFFHHFGKHPSDFYTLQRLDPAYRMFFGRKTVDTYEDLEKNIKLFDNLEPNGGKKFVDYLAMSRYQYDIAMDKFVYKEYRSWKDLANPQFILDGLKLHVFKSINSYVKKVFSSDTAQKLLMYNVVFLGGSPFFTPALYSIMAHVDFNLGVWYPQGGMRKVVDALYKLAVSYGVNFELNQPVTYIEVQHGKAKKVRTPISEFEADIVLANADYHYVETHLLDENYQTYPESYWEKRTVAPSAFLIYLGVKGKVNNLVHHNLFIESNWQQHFDSIFKTPSWPSKFSYYVGCPSKTDPTVAPEGDENIFVLVPIAPGIEDQEAIRSRFYTKVIKHMEYTLGETLEHRIVTKRIFSVNAFKDRYNAYKGTSLGLSHTLWQTALYRPQLKSSKVSNLYYVGQYTHPGIGVPTTLIASELVSKRITSEQK